EASSYDVTKVHSTDVGKWTLQRKYSIKERSVGQKSNRHYRHWNYERVERNNRDEVDDQAGVNRTGEVRNGRPQESFAPRLADSTASSQRAHYADHSGV